MTDDLNERVAMAMGWEFKSFALHPLWVSPNGKDILASAPDYRTDPATIPEMLAWLYAEGERRSRDGEFTLNLTFSSEKSYAFLGDDDRSGADYLHLVSYMPHGAPKAGPINEALARLVCAVAEAKKP